MSRTMSAEALRAIFSPDADSDLLILLTVYDPLNPNSVLVRLSDGYTQRISETDTDVVYGVVSRGQNYIFLPLQITLPQEDEAQAPRCNIVLNDVTSYLTPTIRNLTAPPKVLIELVLSKTPDVVEASFTSFYITNFSYNVNTVTADLTMIDFEREPFPVHSFSPKYFPGLF